MWDSFVRPYQPSVMNPNTGEEVFVTSDTAVDGRGKGWDPGDNLVNLLSTAPQGHPALASRSLQQWDVPWREQTE